MIIHDSFQRRLTYLRLSVTDLCNYRCVYCLPNGYQGKAKPDELSLKEIDTLVTAFSQSGTRKVRLTGGEPTLRKDIVDIIALCKEKPQIETIAITTNAHLLAKKFPAFRQAGLNKVNVSIDGFDEETFYQMTGKHHPQEIISAVDGILAQGFTAIKVNSLLMRQYIAKTLPQALDFVKHRPVTVRFIELMQTLDNHDLFSAQHLSAQAIEHNLQQTGWVLTAKDKDGGPAREYTHTDYLGGIGFITPYGKDFCTSCNRLRVTAQGKVHLCLFASHATDIRDFLRQEDVAGLKQFLADLVQYKPEHHFLHNQKSGLIKDLSMIGG